VFVPDVEGAWIHPERATAEEIAELAHNCPSGAIRYERLDGGPAEAPPRVNLVRMRENGPLAVHAAIAIKGHGSHLRATLCRCGASKKKPFCDGSHTAAEFVASGEATPRDAPALAARDGALAVTPVANGPLAFDGAIEIVTGTGHTIARLTTTALCRCGHSQDKPFCDGAHVKAGFKAEG
jgi:CDGSH-type Zn-finger protein